MGMTSTLYYRIVAADKDRGFNMILSWEKPVVQRTSFQMSTLGTADPKNIQRVLDEVQRFYKVAGVVDTTEETMKKRLAKLYAPKEPEVDVTPEV
ncbi:hypothetical protein UFOVP181_436 [uncultured Caudovirales phage]|uniref:Uncharacterized protein n=1 Tax=uncultured Caudovirales phage TaxID=2100421 RepID=A0A6J5KXN9_9CAUD|nr:hypothetical protein UFOVP57_204 [uncultured Caudovirales phage]CAB5209339.1 hypothetical protein UFOVP181_436 [uncultured Caudovirales phage]